MEKRTIAGYTSGTTAVPTSPITLKDVALVKQSLLFDEEDERYLRLSYDVVKDQVDAILDVWYGFVGSHPHLVATFSSRHDGRPIGDYLERVRGRFGQWILDTAAAEYDQNWLDYQHEIGLRHHRAKKNTTDGAASTDIVPFRYLFALVFPVTHTLRPFLRAKGHSEDDVEGMARAWLKSCILQVTLWCFPYVKEGDF